jgi:hypothetical protein
LWREQLCLQIGSDFIFAADRAGDDSETIENPASHFRRLDGRDDFHAAATARALQDENPS